MQTGKPLAKTWQDSIGMASECKVVKAELVAPNILHILFKDPLGQQFILAINGIAGIGLNGNLVQLNPGLLMQAYEVGS